MQGRAEPIIVVGSRLIGELVLIETDVFTNRRMPFLPKYRNRPRFALYLSITFFHIMHMDMLIKYEYFRLSGHLYSSQK